MATYYVATTGNDTTGDGSIGNPWLTITKGQSMLSPGDTLYVRVGRYYEAVTITKSGTDGSPITISAYQDEEVILDGTEVVTGWTQCEEDDAFLTVQGVVNPNYANIYWAKVHEDDLPSSLSSFMLFENSIHSRIARWPDQELGYGYDTSLFNSVAPEAYGQKDYLLDSTRLTQADDYWAGAWIDIWSHAANNVIVRRTIASSSQSAHTITFTVPLTYAISSGTLPDAYSIVNHPHVLDSAGEFAHTMTPDEDGYYTFYLWPASVSDLTDKIRISSKTTGFYAAHKKYVSIDGFSIKGYTNHGIQFVSDLNEGKTNYGTSISNCIIEDCLGSGIFVMDSNGCVIDNCQIARTGIYGVAVTYTDGTTIKNCLVESTGATNIYYAVVTQGSLINNQLYGSSGVHGNGIACYMDCDKILIAYNLFSSCNLAFQDIKNSIVFANVLDGTDIKTSLFSIWGDSYRGTHEYQLFLNNTIIRSSNNSSFNLVNSSSLPNPLYYVVNNIIDGWNTYDVSTVVDRSYNLYTGYGWKQSSYYGWALEEGDIDGRLLDLDDIFADLSGSVIDYSLQSESPAITKGKNVSAILSDSGAAAWFPDFDFTKDRAGNSWEDTPSIGAYEYEYVDGDGQDSTDIYYNLSYSCSGNGSILDGQVAWISNTKSCLEDSTIILTAQETSLSIFTGWSGDITSSETSITFNMDKDYTIVANFAEAERKSLKIKSLSNRLLILSTKHLA